MNRSISGRILALSSSRVNNGGYLQSAAPLIAGFLGSNPLHIAFVPFAAVDGDYESYTAKVRSGLADLPHQITTVTTTSAAAIIQQCDVIAVGGGNTFKLLQNLYALDLMELIKERVESGIPYIGWSAGSNITGRTICTTNDMPVIQPPSFEALGFFPFQLNPHYHNIKLEGFHGETRDQRLEEFLMLNPATQVVCLPEGTALLQDNGGLQFTGDADGILMERPAGTLLKKRLAPGTDLRFLLKRDEH